jgi:hypothetical protein
MELTSENITELIEKIIEHLSLDSSIREAIEFVVAQLNIESDEVEWIEEFTENSTELAKAIYEVTTINHDEIIEKLKTNSALKAIVEEIYQVFIRRNTTVEILVEEPSMKNVLDIILPQILPEGYALGVNCFIRPHQGKSDLQKSIPIKVNAFKAYPTIVRLIVIQDQDSNDCMVLKQDLIDLIQTQNLHQPHLIRIACKELENWYLGDMQAIEAVYPTFKARTHQRKAKYRHSDNIFGADDLERQIKDFSKGYASKNIPKNMILDKNTSSSFNHLLSGVQRFLN